MITARSLQLFLVIWRTIGVIEKTTVHGEACMTVIKDVSRTNHTIWSIADGSYKSPACKTMITEAIRAAGLTGYALSSHQHTLVTYLAVILLTLRMMDDLTVKFTDVSDLIAALATMMVTTEKRVISRTPKGRFA